MPWWLEFRRVLFRSVRFICCWYYIGLSLYINLTLSIYLKVTFFYSIEVLNSPIKRSSWFLFSIEHTFSTCLPRLLSQQTRTFFTIRRLTFTLLFRHESFLPDRNGISFLMWYKIGSYTKKIFAIHSLYSLLWDTNTALDINFRLGTGCFMFSFTFFVLNRDTSVSQRNRNVHV